jgi:hypothetical protein
MNNLEILEKTLENKRFRVTIKGLVKMDFSMFYTAVFDKIWLKVIPSPDHLIRYGYLKGFINDSINIVRTEFNCGFKEKYDSDIHLRKNLEERILKDPYFMLGENNIVNIQSSYSKGKLFNVTVKTDGGAIVEFFEIECTNLDESNKALTKHNIL